MTTEKTLREELEAAIVEVNAPDPVEDTLDVADVVEDAPARERDETGKFKAKTNDELVAEPVEPVVIEAAPVVQAPQAWTGAMKEKWSTLPPDVQAEINRRENDFHKMVTSREGELRLGRDMKDVITPYMPIITAEGGNPVAAVQGLLNTSYQLRTGTPQQKVALIQEIAQTYGVDIGQVVNPQPQDNYLQSLQNEIAQLKQAVNPQVIMSQLQEQQEHVRIQSDISAFAANPANKHFEAVKATMAPLLASGQAKDLQEAYDMACYANPTIRSTLLQEQSAQAAEKRKAELLAKKQAAVSVTGSPSSSAGNAQSPDRTLREEIAANLAAAQGSKI